MRPKKVKQWEIEGGLTTIFDIDTITNQSAIAEWWKKSGLNLGSVTYVRNRDEIKAGNQWGILKPPGSFWQKIAYPGPTASYGLND